MKTKVSRPQLVLYGFLLTLTFIVNFFIRPYSQNYIALGIDAGVDKDAVLVGFFLNCVLLLFSVAVALYVLLRHKKLDAILWVLLVVNVVAVVYWYRYQPA